MMLKTVLAHLPATPRQSIYRAYYWWRNRERYQRLQAARREIGEYGEYFGAFEEKQCIFVHIPKCAGLAVANSLFGCDGGLHHTISDYEVIFPPRLFYRYWKFTIVRNPWDRLVSAYFFLKKGGLNDMDRRFAKRCLSGCGSFKEFVIERLPAREVRQFYHFRDQADYLVDPFGKMPIDFIGKFESLTEDYQQIAERIGVQSPLLSKNKTEKEHYSEYYTEDLVKAVRQEYRRDIELLKYDFER